MYYDDYWDEPGEFDAKVEEFKDSLRESVKDEIKQKIESLENEIKELNEFKNEKEKFIEKYNSEIYEAKMKAAEAEEKWKSARLHQLLGDYLTVGWKVGFIVNYGEKCNKCDKDRKIHFFSPSGKEYKEDCECAKKYYQYIPAEATLCKFSVRKKNFSNDSGCFNKYYNINEGQDVDWYESIWEDSVYTDLANVNFEKVNMNTAVFLNKEDCQKYCDWKNERREDNT